MHMDKDTRMIFRTSTEEADRIREAAKADGLTTSKLMRDAIMRRVKRIEKKREKAND